LVKLYRNQAGPREGDLARGPRGASRLAPYFSPLKRMAPEEFPCALCKQFLHDYLEYSLGVTFRKREAAAKALHPIFLRDLIADIRALFTENEFIQYRIIRCRAIQKRKGFTDALRYFYKTDVRLRTTFNEWLMLSCEAGIAKPELIERWISYIMYEIFMILYDYHKGHMQHPPSKLS